MSNEIDETIERIEAIFKQNDHIFENFGSLYSLDDEIVGLIKNLIEEVKRNHKKIDLLNNNSMEISFIETQMERLKERRDLTESEMMFIYYNNFIQAYEELIREYRKSNEKK